MKPLFNLRIQHTKAKRLIINLLFHSDHLYFCKYKKNIFIYNLKYVNTIPELFNFNDEHIEA